VVKPAWSCLTEKAINEISHDSLRSSCPASCRASTFLVTTCKTWMAGTSPAMTIENAAEE
jgi:hypothetical protein